MYTHYSLRTNYICFTVAKISVRIKDKFPKNKTRFPVFFGGVS